MAGSDESHSGRVLMVSRSDVSLHAPEDGRQGDERTLSLQHLERNRGCAGEGKLLPGLQKLSGSSTSLIRCMTGRSVGENTNAMSFCFSMPTPCSPVIVPPSSAHICRISLPHAMTCRHCPG